MPISQIGRPSVWRSGAGSHVKISGGPDQTSIHFFQNPWKTGPPRGFMYSFLTMLSACSVAGLILGQVKKILGEVVANLSLHSKQRVRARCTQV